MRFSHIADCGARPNDVDKLRDLWSEVDCEACLSMEPYVKEAERHDRMEMAKMLSNGRRKKFR